MVSLSILNDSFDPKSPWWVVLLSIAVTLLGATVVWQGSLMVLLYFLHPLKQQEQHQHETNLATTAAGDALLKKLTLRCWQAVMMDMIMTTIRVYTAVVQVLMEHQNRRSITYTIPLRQMMMSPKGWPSPNWNKKSRASISMAGD
jgi:hypothetical protein